MPRGLIFDLDGTLVDSLRGIAQALNRTLETHRCPTHDLPAIRRFVGNGMRELLRHATADHVNAPTLDALETTFQSHYRETWQDGTDIYEGIPALLENLTLAGVPLAVLSNKPHGFTQEIVAKLFPGIPFHAVLGQRTGVERKPHPEAALEIAALFDLPTASCVMIGDSTIDIETGRRAGMKTIGVTWGYHDAAAVAAAQADAIAGDVPQLASILADASY
jgi:phosphoglycolate phosphatase